LTPSSDSAPRAPTALWVLLIALTLTWGSNWSLFPVVLQEVSVWLFRFVSLLAGGLLLLGVARWRGLSLRVPRSERTAVIGAALAFLAVWNVASTTAAVLIPSGQAAVLGFTMPLWVALFSALAGRSRITPRMGLALALGALGVLLLAWRALPAYAQAPLGVALGLLAGAGWAIGTLWLKRGDGVKTPPLVLTGWQMVIASVPVALGLVLTTPDLSALAWPSPRMTLIIAYITIVPMALGNLAWFAIVGRLPAQVAGLSSILVPVVAMVSGAIVHGEPLGPVQVAAMISCATSMALALWKPSR
jgi:drug/metabolite transporter (DMT)-like permease